MYESKERGGAFGEDRRCSWSDLRETVQEEEEEGD